LRGNGGIDDGGNGRIDHGDGGEREKKILGRRGRQRKIPRIH